MAVLTSSISDLITLCLILQSVVVFRFSEASKDIGFRKEVFENVGPEIECCKCKEKIQVNPFDMLNYVHGTKTMKDSNEKPTYFSEPVCSNLDAVYLQRFVNMFLISSGLKDMRLSSGNKLVRMDFNVSAEELKLIQDYARTGKGKLEKIDVALSKILREKNVNSMHRDDRPFSIFTDIDYIYYIKLSCMTVASMPVHYPTVCVVVVVTIAFIYTIRHLKAYSLFSAIVIMLLIIFFAGFAWNWSRMIKEEEAKIASIYAMTLEKLPIHCRPHDMTWIERLWYYSYEKDCEKYFKEVSIDPVVRVSPTLVLSETVSMMCLHPLGKLGAAFGGFLAALIDAIPLMHRWYLVPLVLILLFLTVFLTYVVLIGGVIKLKSFLVSFEIGYREQRNANALPCNDYRQMIQNIPFLSRTVAGASNAGGEGVAAVGGGGNVVGGGDGEMVKASIEGENEVGGGDGGSVGEGRRRSRDEEGGQCSDSARKRTLLIRGKGEEGVEVREEGEEENHINFSPQARKELVLFYNRFRELVRSECDDSSLAQNLSGSSGGGGEEEERGEVGVIEEDGGGDGVAVKVQSKSNVDKSDSIHYHWHVTC